MLHHALGEAILLGKEVPHKDPEKAKEYFRKYRAANREAQRGKVRKWYAANREHHLEKSRQWDAANPERKRENSRKWAAEHREQKRASFRKWQAANPEKAREKESRHRALKKGAVVSEVELEFIWCRDKGICYLCGNPIDPDDCHFDHVVPLSKGGSHTVDNLRPTHAKCNLKKSNKLIDLGQVVKWVQKKLF